MVTSGLSAGKVAAELGLHETALRRWTMQYGALATAPPQHASADPSPSDLASENARLRAENAWVAEAIHR